MRVWARGIGVLAVCTVVPGFAAFAQETPVDTAPPAEAPAVETAGAAGGGTTILTLNEDELFTRSAWGSASLRAAETAATDLSSENRAIEASLEEEERSLTAKRGTVSAEEFSAMARAFDARVEEIRQTQDAKSRAINRKLDEDRAAFTAQAKPLLIELLDEYDAVAIVANDALLLWRSSADVTQRAIELIDQRLPAPDPTSDPASLPDQAPAPAPETPGSLPSDPASLP